MKTLKLFIVFFAFGLSSLVWCAEQEIIPETILHKHKFKAKYFNIIFNNNNKEEEHGIFGEKVEPAVSIVIKNAEHQYAFWARDRAQFKQIKDLYENNNIGEIALISEKKNKYNALFLGFVVRAKNDPTKKSLFWLTHFYPSDYKKIMPSENQPQITFHVREDLTSSRTNFLNTLFKTYENIDRNDKEVMPNDKSSLYSASSSIFKETDTSKWGVRSEDNAKAPLSKSKSDFADRYQVKTTKSHSTGDSGSQSSPNSAKSSPSLKLRTEARLAKKAKKQEIEAPDKTTTEKISQVPFSMTTESGALLSQTDGGIESSVQTQLMYSHYKNNGSSDSVEDIQRKSLTPEPRRRKDKIPNIPAQRASSSDSVGRLNINIVRSHSNVQAMEKGDN